MTTQITTAFRPATASRRRGARTVRSVALALILMSFSVPAWAYVPAGLWTTLGNLSQMLTPMVTTARGFDTKLVPFGMEFLSFAFMVEVFMLIVDYLFRGGIQQAMSKAVRLIIITAIPLFLLSNWDSMIWTHLWGFFHDDIAAQFMGGQSSSGIVAQTIQALVNAESLMKINTAQASGITGALDWLVAMIVDGLITVVLFIMNIPLILALIFSLYGPRMLFAVGGIFGPILVCWLPWRATSDFFHAWLKFMLTTGFAYAVGVVLALVTAAGLSNIGTEFQNISSMTGGSASSSLVIVLYMIPVAAMMLFMTIMLMKTEAIASAMIGGARLGGSEGLGVAMGFMIGRAMKGLSKSRGSSGGGGDSEAAAGAAAGGVVGGTAGSMGGGSSDYQGPAGTSAARPPLDPSRRMSFSSGGSRPIDSSRELPPGFGPSVGANGGPKFSDAGKAGPGGASGNASPGFSPPPMTPHETLGVPPNASREDVQRAWRSAVSQNHPDKMHGATPERIAEASQATANANKAYASIAKANGWNKGSASPPSASGPSGFAGAPADAGASPAAGPAGGAPAA